MLLYNTPKYDTYGCVTEDIDDEPDVFGHTREELERLDKADFDWKQYQEDRIGGNTHA